MKLSELKTLLLTTGYPVVYRAFKGKPTFPCIVILMSGSNNFAADNKVYHKSSGCLVELYTEEKDIVAEGKVEAALSELVWESTETYIEDEILYEKIYEIGGITE